MAGWESGRGGRRSHRCQGDSGQEAAVPLPKIKALAPSGRLSSTRMALTPASGTRSHRHDARRVLAELTALSDWLAGRSKLEKLSIRHPSTYTSRPAATSAARPGRGQQRARRATVRSGPCP